MSVWSVSTYPIYVASIPNGDKVTYKGSSVAAVGHTAADGGGPRNAFGNDFNSNGKTLERDLQTWIATTMASKTPRSSELHVMVP